MQEQELEILQGTIAAVVYQNYDNGYAVVRLNLGAGEMVTIVGTIPMPVVGEQLMVTGQWKNNANYGKQFEAEFLERLMPQSTSGILSFLSSRIIKGVGPKMAARIVDTFGADTLNVMQMHPELLSKVTGISTDKALAIGKEFALRMGMRSLMEFFSLHHLPAELAVRTYKMYGDNAIDLLQDDPYLLMDRGLDAPFGAVDRFALELGVPGDAPRRIEAGIVFELTYNLSAGHSFLPEEKLVNATSQLLSVPPDAVGESLAAIADAERINYDTLIGRRVVYLPELHEAESYCTQKLLELCSNSHSSTGTADPTADSITALTGMHYSEQQQSAIRQACGQQVVIITGGPGTGKTTVLKGILALFQRTGLRCLLAAPTGRAAKRLSDVTGEEASTIHRLLEAGIDLNTGEMVFTRDADNPLKCDAVIVDEMSMVDILLLSSLLHAIPPGVKLVLVGDPDQLPPVGPGFPLSDMIRSGQIPVAKLTEIFRQAQQSLIVMNAHSVNNGVQPELHSVKNDFFFIAKKTEEAVGAVIRDLCTTRLPTKLGIPSSDIQVLSPTRKGGVGTASLNKILQEALNPARPEKKERRSGEVFFREGDRVMQIRNNYDIPWKKPADGSYGNGIFNGDIGVIVSISMEMEAVKILFDDKEAEYDFSQLNELELAYAVTVHKSQGSEYRAVILVAWNGSPYLLTRNVLYTGITRAKELLIVVGKEETVWQMTANVQKNRRYTGLKLRLQGAAKT